MGFADLSIQSIATEYDLTVQSVFDLCDQLGIAYKNQDTNLALEDAKAVIMQILHRQQSASELGGLSWHCRLVAMAPVPILTEQKPSIFLAYLIKTLFLKRLRIDRFPFSPLIPTVWGEPLWNAFFWWRSPLSYFSLTPWSAVPMRWS